MLGRPFENAVVVLIETFLTPRSQTHDSQTQLTPTSLEPGTHKTHTGVPDAWTELLFQFVLPFVQEAGKQLRNHHGAPRIVSGVGR